jgi:hypothetical protein
VLAGCGRIGFDLGAGDALAGGDTLAGDAVIDADLVAWYPMDTDPTLGVPDATANHIDGTCTICPVMDTGVHGGAYRFDGTKQIFVAYNPKLNVVSGTVAVWVRLDSLDVSTQRSVIQKNLAANTSHDSFEIFLGATPGLGLFGGSDTVVCDYGKTAWTAPIGTWGHVALTWDAGRLELFLDGVSTATSSTFSNTFDAGNMYMGAGHTTGPDTFLIGAIDDVRIYRRVLSAQEIAALAVP